MLVWSRKERNKGKVGEEEEEVVEKGISFLTSRVHDNKKEKIRTMNRMKRCEPQGFLVYLDVEILLVEQARKEIVFVSFS